MKNENMHFSDTARVELDKIFAETLKCVSNSVEALQTHSTELAEKVISEEERVDNLEERLRSEHIERLANKACNPTVGVVYLDVLTNLERVSDHALNVAQVVIKHNENN
jgi:phosphate:Na+ symporter